MLPGVPHPLLDWQIQFLVGAIAGVSWRGLAPVVGVDALEEAITKNIEIGECYSFTGRESRN